jgi:hypothetical protein
MSIAVIIYLYIVFLMLAFLADCLPFLILIKRIAGLGANSFKTIRSANIPDTEKEKLLLFNALNMFKQSLKIIGFIALIIICGLILIWLTVYFKVLTYTRLYDYIITLNGLLLTSAAFFSYYLLKKLYVKVRL